MLGTRSATNRWSTSTATTRPRSPPARWSRHYPTAFRPTIPRRELRRSLMEAHSPRRRPTTGLSCTCVHHSSPRTTWRRIAIVLIGALVAVAVAARATGTTIRRFSPHFFVLGVAFLLLTTRSLTSFSLLFGTTWLVNSLAFFGILASVLVAIFVNSRLRIRQPNTVLRSAVRLGRRGLPVTAGIAALRTRLAALRGRRGRRLCAGLLRQPGLLVLVQGHEHGGHGFRQQPARAPWSEARSNTWP